MSLWAFDTIAGRLKRGVLPRPGSRLPLIDPGPALASDPFIQTLLLSASGMGESKPAAPAVMLL
jgi:hypothetical protein